MAKTAASSQAKNIGKKKPRVDYSLSPYQLVLENGAHKMLIDSCLSYSNGLLARLAHSCSPLAPLPRLPNEMMVQVFGVIAESGSLGLESLLAARSVCHQWNSLINSSKLLSTKFTLLTVDRLVVTFDDQQKCYELRWCNYESHKSRILLFSPKQVKCNRLQLCFAFNRLDIRRIVFQSLPSGSFNDDLVRFLCRLFSYCRHFKPKGLSIKNVSLKKLSAAGLYSLMAMCGKTLETFQACKLSGLKPDSITDAHLSLLNLTNLRSLVIESVKFGSSQKYIPLLQIGDETLRKLIHRHNYPSLKLEKCSITARMVGQYMESWLAKASVVQQQQDGIPNVCSHMFVLKECPAVSNAQFEKECRRRSLDYSQGMPSLMPAMTTKAVNYSIHRVESIKEFMVTLTTSANNNSIPVFSSSSCDSQQHSTHNIA